MSGGSMNYLSDRVAEAEFRENTLMRRAFRAHLAKVATALRAVEWNDSGDGNDDEDALITACLGPWAELEQAVAEARAAAGGLYQQLRLYERLTRQEVRSDGE